MAAHSAGLLVYRDGPDGIEVFLVHPGGPFWARKDDGAWSIPKGEYGADEDPLAAARREFAEETGQRPRDGEVLDLGEVRQRGGKVVRAFAVRGEVDAAALVSNTVEIQWPPRSGQMREFPEVDRGDWFGLARAAEKINAAQAEFLGRLAAAVDS
ncbi:NUDIX domain-containing protein [Gordonia sp. X0973]|uniref:NUDIX domain-containing protein n=1 Tax=Gordonia sp. X0973 TaxID=2742602 RepID=UPI000F54204B|nr:NUDIX domain-containing protein [Gordonia sp. X0973]QKT08110.1 NUDIX domain-containing protein [Gordonia sp. X0973]